MDAHTSRIRFVARRGRVRPEGRHRLGWWRTHVGCRSTGEPLWMPTARVRAPVTLTLAPTTPNVTIQGMDGRCRGRTQRCGPADRGGGQTGRAARVLSASCGENDRI